MRFVFEANIDALELAEALYETKFVRIDQDIIDRRIFEQRLDRAKADHFGENLGGK